MYTLGQHSHRERVLSDRIDYSEDTWDVREGGEKPPLPRNCMRVRCCSAVLLEVEHVALDCHEPLDQAIREGDRQVAKNISPARESGDRSRRAL
jgi:hypothetical protein